MKTNLLNSLPNTVLISAAKQGFKSELKPIKTSFVELLLSEGVNSFVGHADFAEILSKNIGVDIPTNRAQYTPGLNDATILALVSPQRRLNEGEKWSVEEILAMPIEYFLLSFSIFYQKFPVACFVSGKKPSDSCLPSLDCFVAFFPKPGRVFPCFQSQSR